MEILLYKYLYMIHGRKSRPFVFLLDHRTAGTGPGGVVPKEAIYLLSTYVYHNDQVQRLMVDWRLAPFMEHPHS